jgi:parvulin-like peptidyl-prolyl isomerase
MDTGKVDTGDIYQFAVKAKVDALSFRAALALKDGEVSEPIELSDGVHLIVMLKHRFPVPQTYEEAENQIWTDYRADAQSKVNAANLAYLRARADITVAPEYVP